MKKMFLGVFAIVIGALASPQLLFAGKTVAAIDRIQIYAPAGLIFVFPAGKVQNVAKCAAHSWYYSFKMDRPMAREIYDALLTAYATNSTVTFWGWDACIDHKTTETLKNVMIDN